MAKLYFSCAAMNAGKSTFLLGRAFNDCNIARLARPTEGLHEDGLPLPSES